MKYNKPGDIIITPGNPFDVIRLVVDADTNVMLGFVGAGGLDFWRQPSAFIFTTSRFAGIKQVLGNTVPGDLNKKHIIEGLFLETGE